MFLTIMSTKERECLRKNRLLEILWNAARIGINRKLLCRNNLITEISGNIVWWSHFLIKTHEYDIQLRTLLNFATDAFVSVFWNSFTENFEKYTEKRVKWSSHKRKLQSITSQ